MVSPDVTRPAAIVTDIEGTTTAIAFDPAALHLMGAS